MSPSVVFGTMWLSVVSPKSVQVVLLVADLAILVIVLVVLVLVTLILVYSRVSPMG